MLRRWKPLRDEPREQRTHGSVSYAQQHSIFMLLPPWSGKVPREFWPTTYGSLVRWAFRGDPPRAADSEHPRHYPALEEEYFEWVDLVESVAFAGDRYTMLELGAGYGRWAVAAAMVLRLYRPSVRFELAAFEADGGHFEMLKQHFLDNGLRPDDHWLAQNAVSENDGSVSFSAGLSNEWWGQQVLSDADADAPALSAKLKEGARVEQVPSISLRTILARYQHVDLIDMDIQGHEAIVCKAAAEELDRKVQRVHIGTHSPEIEGELQSLFGGMGWLCYHNFPSNRKAETAFGPVDFDDGVQTWLNPRFAERGQCVP